MDEPTTLWVDPTSQSTAHLLHTSTLKGIGEVQSPPGLRRLESKTAALLKAGVHTIGQFTKPGVFSVLPAVVLHKDKTVQVAMASLNGEEKTIENSLGSVTFRLVG